jgi:hypothetical protein
VALVGVVVAAFALTGCLDAPTRPKRHGQTVSVTVEATVGADGAIVVDATHVFAGDHGTVAVRAPTLATASGIQLNGAARSDTANGYTVQEHVSDTHQVKLHHEVEGAVERYQDIAVATIPVWAVPDDAHPRDPTVRLSGVVHLPAAADDTHLHTVADPATSASGTTVTFRARAAMNEDADLVIDLPAAAFPTLDVLPGGARREYLEHRQALDDRADARLASKLDHDSRRDDVIAVLYWLLVLVEIAAPFAVALPRMARSAALRRRATESVQGDLIDPPGDESPAIVALLAADGHDIGPEAVAGTVLDLAQRDVISLTGITSERYVITPKGDHSPNNAVETALVDALRAIADHDGNVTGPPLALPREGPWWKAIRRDTLRQARAAGLVRRRYPSGVFIASVIALTLTTLPLWGRTPELAFVGLVVGALLCMLPFVGGYVLSPSGHMARAKWEAFGRYAKEHSEMATAGAPAIAVWGPHLSYGAALGLAEQAVHDLTPHGDATEAPAAPAGAPA